MGPDSGNQPQGPGTLSARPKYVHPSDHRLPRACDSASHPPFSPRSSWHHKSCCKQRAGKESKVVRSTLTSMAESDLPGGGGPGRLPSPAAHPGMPCYHSRRPALFSSELPLTTRHLGLECGFSTPGVQWALGCHGIQSWVFS